MKKFLLLFLPSLAFCQDYACFIEKGEKAYEKKEYRHGALYYDSASFIKPLNASDYYSAACLNSLAGNTSKAVVFLNRSFELGMDNFDWMYYDKDLEPIRSEFGYKEFEKRYKKDSVIYFFDILSDLAKQDEVIYRDKRISLGSFKWNGVPEKGLADYSLQEIRKRAGLPLSDSIFDFSKHTLKFLNCNFSSTTYLYNQILPFLKLDRLEFDSECEGSLFLSNLEINRLFFSSKLKELSIANVQVREVFQIYNYNSSLFEIRNCVFQADRSIMRRKSYVSDYGEFDFGFSISGGSPPGIINIENSKFLKAKNDLSAIHVGFLLHNVGTLKISNSEFAPPLKLFGSVETTLEVDHNEFINGVDLLKFHGPELGYYMPMDQFKENFVELNYDGKNYSMKGDSAHHYKDTKLFNKLVAVYKQLYNNYRTLGELNSANASYVKLKDLEIEHLKQSDNLEMKDKIRLRLNQLMGLYTDHGTNPGKAIILSFYIVILFAVFYFWFPSEWDKESKSELIADFKIFISKNEYGYFKPFLKLAKGLFLSFLNAFTLSTNSFVTLGFGAIPTTGVARYVCVFQGLLGWFLLSLFTVALINQVLL